MKKPGRPSSTNFNVETESIGLKNKFFGLYPEKLVEV